MTEIISTVVIVLLICGAIVASVRKLWKDKRRGKTCCGGCDTCCGCKGKEFKTKE